MTVTAQCADNAHTTNSTSLIVTCTSEGNWSSETPHCQCDEGYNLVIVPEESNICEGNLSSRRCFCILCSAAQHYLTKLLSKYSATDVCTSCCCLFIHLDVDNAERNVSIGKTALVSLSAVSLLFILFLTTSTAVCVICLLKLRKKKTRERKKCSTTDVHSSKNVASKGTGDRSSPNQSSKDNRRAIAKARGLKCENNVAYEVSTYTHQHITEKGSKCSDTTSTASPTLSDVESKKSVTYKGAAEGVKQKGIMKMKTARLSTSDVECKKNEAYGGVIREVTLALQERSESSNIGVSPNKAYTICKPQKGAKTDCS